jgi:cytochrome c oxidase assembly protein Cox11
MGNGIISISLKMHPLLRRLIQIAIIFTVVFFAVQPFNWFCQITQKCQPFYFSYLIPRQQGDLVKIKLQITNYHQGLDFKAVKADFTTRTNKINTVTYNAKNNSRLPIRFRPALYIEPKNFEKYVITYQCLCANEYKLKPNEEIKLQMRFFIARKIEDEEEFVSPDGQSIFTIKIRYQL